ncbi:synaptonemal complex central element protein 1 [Acipenser ruthenus]|nr:synaptonemal complex central element protein 1 [Acipenser ruthenus]
MMKTFNLTDSSFDMEAILKLMNEPKNGEKVEPKVEDLMNKLRKVQQGKISLEEELKEAQSLRKTLYDELDALNAESSRLEDNYKEKEESCRILRFKCEELEVETSRQLKNNSTCEEIIKEYTFQIQEAKLKHRKQRMEFEKQLEQLMKQHKNLYEIYSPQRLPEEIKNMELTNAQRLNAEKFKLRQIHSLEEELGAHGGFGATAEDKVEKKFLYSREAAAAYKLFKQENDQAKLFLQEGSQHHSALQQENNSFQEMQ